MFTGFFIIANAISQGFKDLEDYRRREKEDAELNKKEEMEREVWGLGTLTDEQEMALASFNNSRE